MITVESVVAPGVEVAFWDCNEVAREDDTGSDVATALVREDKLGMRLLVEVAASDVSKREVVCIRVPVTAGEVLLANVPSLLEGEEIKPVPRLVP